MNDFNKWLDTLIEEKGIDLETEIEVEGKSGTNFMTVAIVVEHMKITTDEEKKGLKAMLVKLDFYNANIVDYFKHLAKALAK